MKVNNTNNTQPSGERAECDLAGHRRGDRPRTPHTSTTAGTEAAADSGHRAAGMLDRSTTAGGA